MHASLTLTTGIASAILVATTAVAGQPDCVPQREVDVTTIRSQIVMVGERHGTVEIPAFVARLLCSLLRADRPVILALETDGAEQAAVNRYLASSGTPEDQAVFLRAERWQDDCQDGRKSVAMLALIEAVRGWRRGGQRVGIAIIGPNENVTAPLTPAEEAAPLPPADGLLAARIGDRSLADNLLLTALLYRSYTVVSLSGFLHASTLKGNARDADYLPMGHLVTRQQPAFVIGIETGAGSSWSSGPSGCGAGPIPAQTFYSVGTQVDAIVRFDTVTASPPARSVAD